MKTIFKYPVGFGTTDVEMPRGAKILSVYEQGGMPMFWAEVEDAAPSEVRRFLRVGTGWSLDEALKEPRIDGFEREYVGTAHCGPYVWHIFELKAVLQQVTKGED